MRTLSILSLCILAQANTATAHTTPDKPSVTPNRSSIPMDYRYTVKVGAFPSKNLANGLVANMCKAILECNITRVSDSSGSSWWVVTVGRYKSADEAQSAGARLSEDMGIAGPLPVMMFPATQPVPRDQAIVE